MLHITRPQVITMFGLIMTLPIDAELDHVDTDNQGAHLLKAHSEFGERWFRLHKRGSYDDVTARYAEHKPVAIAEEELELVEDLDDAL